MPNRPISRTERLHEIERLLLHSPDGMRVVEIARACGVDRRTIYRDLITLEESGVPLLQESGRYRVIHEQYETELRLAFQEAVTVLLALQVYAEHPDRLSAHLVAVAEKLAAALTMPLAAPVQAWATALGRQAHQAEFKQGTVLELLALAWLRRRKLRVWIEPIRADSVTMYDLAVVFFEPHPPDVLLLVGWDDVAGVLRVVDVQHIKQVQMLDTVAVLPEWLQVDGRFLLTADAMQAGKSAVVLAFPPEVVPQVRGRRWHALQEITELPDGSCRLTVYVDDWRELRGWVQAWGAQVRVIAPRVMREEIAREAARVLALYQENEDAVRV
ncbi:MAG: WYL domain-containing protein [Anaerolineae bacterium]|nr:WYL domain-containing protein [Anaerolineae bacterium]